MCHILYMFMKIHNNKFLINTMWNTLTAPLPFNTSGKEFPFKPMFSSPTHKGYYRIDKGCH